MTLDKCPNCNGELQDTDERAIVCKNCLRWFCTKCGDRAQYDSWEDGYDAYYCESCNEWITEKCSDPECEFCATRPDYPDKVCGDNT